MRLATTEATLGTENSQAPDRAERSAQQKILVIGTDTRIGAEFSAMLAESPHVVSVARDSIELGGALERERNWREYKIIVNAGGYDSVDQAETREGRVAAWSANAVVTGRLARIARDYGIILVQFSSDDVFDGTKEGAYTEDDPLSPVSVFGQSRAAGELAAMAAPKHYIIRAGWVMSNGATFLNAMKRFAEDGSKPRVVNDLRGRLTFTHDLARAVRHLLAAEPEYGVYNVSSSGPVLTWEQIAREVFIRLGHNPARVRGRSAADFHQSGAWTMATRPRNAVLDLGKITATGFVPGDQYTRIREYLSDTLGASDLRDEVDLRA